MLYLHIYSTGIPLAAVPTDLAQILLSFEVRWTFVFLIKILGNNGGDYIMIFEEVLVQADAGVQVLTLMTLGRSIWLKSDKSGGHRFNWMNLLMRDEFNLIIHCLCFFESRQFTLVSWPSRIMLYMSNLSTSPRWWNCHMWATRSIEQAWRWSG